jgi:hypothetical protein
LYELLFAVPVPTPPTSDGLKKLETLRTIFEKDLNTLISLVAEKN